MRVFPACSRLSAALRVLFEFKVICVSGIREKFLKRYCVVAFSNQLLRLFRTLQYH